MSFNSLLVNNKAIIDSISKEYQETKIQDISDIRKFISKFHKNQSDCQSCYVYFYANPKKANGLFELPIDFDHLVQIKSNSEISVIINDRKVYQGESQQMPQIPLFILSPKTIKIECKDETILVILKLLCEKRKLDFLAENASIVNITTFMNKTSLS